MYDLKSPGVYRYEEERFLPQEAELETGVPAFLGCYPIIIPKDTLPIALKSWDEFEEKFPEFIALRNWAEFQVALQEYLQEFDEEEKQAILKYVAEEKEYIEISLKNSFLPYSVSGFFENGGSVCYVISIDSRYFEKLSESDKKKIEIDSEKERGAFQKGIDLAASLDDMDIVCAPDIMKNREERNSTKYEQAAILQAKVLEHCEHHGDRFAILDSIYKARVIDIQNQRAGILEHSTMLRATYGALYFPWIGVQESVNQSSTAEYVKYIPPCGHIAGVYARSDKQIGVHKAPANEILEGVLDLDCENLPNANLTNAEQDILNPSHINCIRAFPGRGIRIWGARTIADDSSWRYINVRRLFLTISRWIDRNMRNVTFEIYDTKLWSLIEKQLIIYFNDLFKRGALKGNTAKEAFYVKCDKETNPPEIRDTGMVIVEIGLAPTVPNEFVVIRIIRSASGFTITEA
ncbi:MAG: phage tail sheath family protein [bacterium]